MRLVYRWLIIFLMFMIAWNLSGCSRKPELNRLATAEINGQQLRLEVVSTDSAMAQGLSGRTELCENCGMLFNYGNDYQVRDFWMKEMNFPLDYLWLKDDLVVGLTKDVPVLTDGQITRLQSPEAVNQVIEVKAGLIEKSGVKIGDQLKY